MTWFFESFPIPIYTPLCQSVEVSFWLSEQSTRLHTRLFLSLSFFLNKKSKSVQELRPKRCCASFIYFFLLKQSSYLYPIMFHHHYIYTSFCLATSWIVLITSHVSLSLISDSLSLSIARRLFVVFFSVRLFFPLHGEHVTLFYFRFIECCRRNLP